MAAPPFARSFSPLFLASATLLTATLSAVADIRTGKIFNEIAVTLDSTALKPVKWLDLMLSVRHPATTP